MTYIIYAKYIELQNDSYGITLAFTDEKGGEGDYVMLQKCIAPDAQDQHLGLDKVYIEVNSQIRACYGGIASVRLSGDVLTIQLTEGGRKRTQVQSDILIRLPESNRYITEKLSEFFAKTEGEFLFEL